jgi:hypothetical protein
MTSRRAPSAIDEVPAASRPASPWADRVGAFVADRYLSLDVRWLAIFRIALGALLVVEVLRRWHYAPAFYTNDGLLPNHYSLFAPMGRNVFSIYHAFSTYGEVSVAFFLTLLVFLAFTVGYRTRLFHVLSAICITSLNARNLFVENGGTVVVNLLTVYTAFLPLGERFSLDAIRRSFARRRDRSVLDLNQPDSLRGPERAMSVVVLLLLVQWSAIYFFNTVQKDGEGWRNGSALHWFYQQDRIVTAFGVWVRAHVPESVLTVATYGALVVEGSLSVLILSPVFQKWTRRAVLLLVWSLHGFIALSARIGPFSYAMMLFPLLLLGADDFELVTRRWRKPERARTVVLDPSSPLAFQLARVLDRLDPFDRLSFVDRRQALLVPSTIPSDPLVVLDRGGRAHRRSAALVELARALPFGLPVRLLLAVPPVSSAVDHLMRRFARRGHRWAAELGVETLPADPARTRPVALTPEPAVALLLRRALSPLRETAAGLLGVAVVTTMLVQNRFVTERLQVHRAEWMTLAVEYPRLLQGWSMFAPEPPYEDGRVVVDGRTADGRRFDPFAGGTPSFETEAPRGWGHSQFWCDYHNRIRYRDSAPHRQHLRDYLLRQHELSGHPENRLVAFDVWWLQDRSPAPGETRGTPLPPEKLLSYGRVRDSAGDPILEKLRARGPSHEPEPRVHGP